jgi:hypothetical protein
LLPSVSHAACIATGTVPRVFVQGAVTNIGVRANGAGTTFFNFTTNNLAFISAADSDECQHGMRDGLAAELREGIDYELTVRNAQGDMPTLSSLVDAALGDGSDLILTLSTPTLQAAVQRVKSTPIVFSFSSNPLGAGAGTTYEQHLPNVTGVPTTAAYEPPLSFGGACYGLPTTPVLTAFLKAPKVGNGVAVLPSKSTRLIRFL